MLSLALAALLSPAQAQQASQLRGTWTLLVADTTIDIHDVVAVFEGSDQVYTVRVAASLDSAAGESDLFVSLTCSEEAGIATCNAYAVDASLDSDIVFHEYGHGLLRVDLAAGAAVWTDMRPLASWSDAAVAVAWVDLAAGVLANGQADWAQQQGQRNAIVEAGSSAYRVSIRPQ